MAKKKPSKKPSKTLLAYRAERKRISSTKSALKKMGFTFSEDIIPKIVKNPTRADIKELKKITREYLYSKASSYITKEGYVLTPEQGRIERKLHAYNLRVKQITKANVERSAKSEKYGISSYELKERIGEELYYQWKKILDSNGWRAALDFERSLTDDEHDFFEKERIRADRESGVYDEYEESDFGTESGRNTGESVLPDERVESESETEDETAYYSDEEGEDVARFEDEASKKKDARYEEWVDQYNRQKSLPPKERVYAKEGEVVYAGIKERISRFWAELRDPTFKRRHNTDNNESKANLLETLLENTIKIEGFNVVMNRLSGKGHEIDSALDTMLYDSDDNKVDAAYMQIAHIINDGAMTVKESIELTEAAERMSFSREAEDYQL